MSASTSIGRAGAALRQKRPSESSQARRTASSGTSSCVSTASPGGSSNSFSSAFAPGATAIWFSPPASTRISATPVGASTRAAASVRRSSCGNASSAKTSVPTEQTRVTSAPRRAAATAWLAPLPPLTRAKVASVTVSPGRGSRSTRATRSRLTLPTTVMLGGKRSQVVHGGAEQRVAQVEETGPERGGIRRRVEPRRVGEALERAHEHGQLQVDGRDAVRGRLDAGARQHRLPLDELTRAGTGVPGAALGLVGLELEQVSAQRHLQPGKRGLDPVGRVAERSLATAGRRRQ